MSVETNPILKEEKEAQKNLVPATITTVLLIIFLLVFFLMVKLVFVDHHLAFDEKVAALAHSKVSDFLTSFFVNLTFFGSQNFLLPAYLILVAIFLVIKKLRKYSWRILATGVSGTIVMFGFKYLFGRDRPLEPLLGAASGHSFPSGHAFSSLLFFGILIFIVIHAIKNNWLKYSLIIFLLFFSLLVGLSRIYLNVHYATDVIAGFSLAICWLLLSDWILFKKLNFFYR